jgi:hypothetical protein
MEEMSMHRVALLVFIAVVMTTGAAWANSLPVENEQTEFVATVSEQADLLVPDEILFDVTDVTQDTLGGGVVVSATTCALVNGNALRIELKADAASFTPATGTSETWDAADVSWDAAAWTGGSGSAGVLSSAAYTKVADGEANAAEVSTAGLSFTLQSNSAIDRAGAYMLTASWRFTSFTP